MTDDIDNDGTTLHESGGVRLREVRELEYVLQRNGFVRCDLAACNCGSWHARYGLPQRMDEIKEALSDAGHPLCNENGSLVLEALRALVAERDALAARPHSGGFADVFAELERATSKFPTWPTDPLHALTVLGEEFGELTKDMLQMVYEPHKTSRENVRTEALQTAAMALRLFASLDRYEYQPGAQHSQSAPMPPRAEDRSQS